MSKIDPELKKKLLKDKLKEWVDSERLN